MTNEIKNANQERTNIFISGLGWSGASATVDFFKNFSQTAVCPYEFDTFRAPSWHIGPVSGPMDIVRRFSENKNIEEDVRSFKSLYYLLGVHWYFGFGNEYFDLLDRLCDVFLNFNNTFRQITLKNPARYSELQAWTKRLTAIVAETMTKLLNCYEPEKKLGIFEHGIRSWENIDSQFPFLPSNIKIIVNIRDPRDSWADMIGHPDWWKANKLSIEKFIESRKRLYECMQTNSNKVMIVRFEDLCLNTDSTAKKLMNFAGLDENSPLNTEKYFDPKVSMKNIGIYKKMPNQDDYIKIEQELPEYIWQEQLIEGTR